MSESEKLFNLIPINEVGQNLLVINDHICTKETAHELSNMLIKRNANFLGIIMVAGPPSESIMNISVDDLEKKI